VFSPEVASYIWERAVAFRGPSISEQKHSHLSFVLQKTESIMQTNRSQSSLGQRLPVHPWRIRRRLIACLAVTILALGCGVGTTQTIPNPKSSSDSDLEIEAALSILTAERLVEVIPELNQAAAQDEKKSADKPIVEDSPQWVGKPVSLFDGKSLEGWETIEFGGEGDCEAKDNVLSIGCGVMMTGISSTQTDLPKTNYEIAIETRKLDGTDFFCGLTFPVAESHCSLIVGGWGGATVGLSCINDKDASSNNTTSYMKFEEKQWYKIRVRVEPTRISAWIDGVQVINEVTTGQKISLRGDTDLCTPIGICNFMTSAEYRNITIREFKPSKPTDTKPTDTKPTSKDK
jgi:hypothetical protein